MEKKMILVGLSNRSLGWDFFKAVLDSLDRCSIKYDRVDCIRLRFETPHTKTWFVFASDPNHMLEGIRADAIFGSGYKRLLYRAKPDAVIAHRDGVGLVDYISDVEYQYNVEQLKTALLKPYPVVTYDVDVPSMYPSTLYMKPLTETEKRLYKRMINATYGKFGVGSDYEVKYLGKWHYSDEAIEAMKQMDSDFNRFVNNKIEAAVTKGENNMNMNTVYNDLVRGRNACLVTDNGKVPVKIENITSSYEYGSTKIEFEGRMLTPTLSDIIDRRVTSVMNKPTTKLPGIKTVHFSGPVTVVIWEDKTKTVVRCNNENVDYEKGLAMAIAKKAFGTNKSGSNYYDIFKKWLPEDKEEVTEEKAEKPVEVVEEK